MGGRTPPRWGWVLLSLAAILALLCGAYLLTLPTLYGRGDSVSLLLPVVLLCLPVAAFAVWKAWPGVTSALSDVVGGALGLGAALACLGLGSGAVREGHAGLMGARQAYAGLPPQVAYRAYLEDGRVATGVIGRRDLACGSLALPGPVATPFIVLAPPRPGLHYPTKIDVRFLRVEAPFLRVLTRLPLDFAGDLRCPGGRAGAALPHTLHPTGYGPGPRWMRRSLTTRLPPHRDPGVDAAPPSSP